MTVVLATRRSPLALAQTAVVADHLEALGAAVEVLELTTAGDRWSAQGGAAPDKGAFVTELENALIEGRADLAVHSAKDVPTDLPDGLALLGVSSRADPRDVVVGAPGGLPGLPPGARVGTGSPRRAAQVLEARPDLEIVDMRGNVGTRLDKLAAGQADALVLAGAGLERLGLGEVSRAPLPVDLCTPAPGQGFLALEGRAGDARVGSLLDRLGTEADLRCLEIERAVLRALGGGCRSAVGAHCYPLAVDLWRLTVYERAEGASVGRRVVQEGGDVERLVGTAVETVRAER